MIITDCNYIKKDDKYIIFIKNPRKNAKWSNAFGETCSDVCQQTIGAAYIKSCHKNENSTMIVVTSDMQPLEIGFTIPDASIEGIAYLEPITVEDFNNIHRPIYTNSSTTNTNVVKPCQMYKLDAAFYRRFLATRASSPSRSMFES